MRVLYIEFDSLRPDHLSCSQRHTAYQIWYGFAEMHDMGKGGLDNADGVHLFGQRWRQENGRR